MRRIIAAGSAALPFFYATPDAQSLTAAIAVSVDVDRNRTTTRRRRVEASL
jgi:hypothetical protein